jgi:hypothetical protein
VRTLRPTFVGGGPGVRWQSPSGRRHRFACARTTAARHRTTMDTGCQSPAFVGGFAFWRLCDLALSPVRSVLEDVFSRISMQQMACPKMPLSGSGTGFDVSQQRGARAAARARGDRRAWRVEVRAERPATPLVRYGRIPIACRRADPRQRPPDGLVGDSPEAPKHWPPKHRFPPTKQAAGPSFAPVQ